MTLRFEDLGILDYAGAYLRQCQAVEEVLAARALRQATSPDHAAGVEPPPDSDLTGIIILVEHPPVITVSRRPTAAANVTASAQMLRQEGVTVVETDRGGDVTYHGPGQLVVYPILDLNALNLRLHDYMRLLEDVVIKTVTGFGIAAGRDICATGVWVNAPRQAPLATSGPACALQAPAHGAKICAMGVRVRKWVSMHGLALNVTTNLNHFGLIVPCGLVGRQMTSMENELADLCPTMNVVKRELMENLRRAIESRVNRPA